MGLHNIKGPQRRSTSKTDWKEYTKDLTIAFSNNNNINITNINELESSVTKFYDIINKVNNKHCPITTPKDKPVFNRWWNTDLAEMADKTSKAFKTYKKQRTQESRNTYKELKANYTKMLKKAQCKSFREFVHETSSLSDMARLNKILNKTKSHQIGMLQNPDGSLSHAPEESCDILLAHAFKGSTKLTTEATKSDDDIITESDLKGNFQPIKLPWLSVDSLREAIFRFNPKKAPGPDLITARMMRYFPDSVLNYLIKIYEASLTSSYTPQIWLKSRTVFVPKPGKDSTKPNAYRPIGLLSVLFKLLERLILDQLNDTDLNDNPLHITQHGFRKGHSTETALHRVVNHIEKAINQPKGVAIMLLLDVEGAFDNIHPHKVAKLMRKRGMNPVFVDWYENYLINRFTIVEIKGLILIRKLFYGTPQGGILSPIIWNIYIDELLIRLEVATVLTNAYADDVNLVKTGFFPQLEYLKREMQKAIVICEQWADEMGLKLSHPKTECIIIRKSTRKYNTSPLLINNLPITYVTSCKYLGLTFTSTLSWSKHIQEKIVKVRKLLHATRSSLSRSWGPSPYLIRWSYTQCIRPILTYGCFIWGKSLVGTLRGKMASLQRQALMQCGNFRDKTPLEALNVIFGVKPIHLYVKELLVRANLRFKQTYLCSMREPSVYGHWNYSERLFNNVQIDLENSDFYYNKFPVPNYRTEIDLHQIVSQ